MSKLCLPEVSSSKSCSSDGSSHQDLLDFIMEQIGGDGVGDGDDSANAAPQQDHPNATAYDFDLDAVAKIKEGIKAEAAPGTAVVDMDSIPLPVLENPPPTSQTCLVCGRHDNPDRSAYGGRSCNSCRAFFRRSVLSGREQRFECKAGDACRIDSKSWKSCQKCRLMRCFKFAGMRRELVFEGIKEKLENGERVPGLAKDADLAKLAAAGDLGVDEEADDVDPAPTAAAAPVVVYPQSHRDRSKKVDAITEFRAMEIKLKNRESQLAAQFQLRPPPEEGSAVPCLLTLTPSDPFTLEERVLAEGLHEHLAGRVAGAWAGVVRRGGRPVLEEVCRVLTHGDSFSLTHLASFTRAVTDNPLDLLPRFGDLESLEPEDRATLARAFPAKLLELWTSVTLDSVANTSRRYKGLVKAVLSTGNKEVGDVLEAYGVSEGTVFPAVRYHQLYPNEANLDTPTILKHRQLVLKLGQFANATPAAPGADPEEDPVKTVLLAMLVLFSPRQQEPLRDPRAVSLLQRKYAYMLHKHLASCSQGSESGGTGPSHWLSECMMMVDQIATQAANIRAMYFVGGATKGARDEVQDLVESLVS